MIKGRSINVVRGIFYGICSRVILIIAPFIVKTMIIYTLGIQYVGLDSLFSSVLEILNFTELGIGSALIYSMYKPISERNISEVNALLNFYKRCYSVIGIVILFFGSCLIPLLNKIVNKDIPVGLNIYILYIIVLIDTVLGYFLFAYKKSILLANQRVDLINKINGIINVLKYLIQIFLLILVKNFYLFYSIRIIFTILNNIISAWYVDKYFPEYSASGSVSSEFLIQIKKKVVGLICSKFGNTILISSDSIIISTFLGLTALGQYNSYFSILNSAVSLIAILSTAFLPSVGNYLVQETKDKSYKIFRIINLTYTWIITWFSAIMFSLYQPFMKVWIGEENLLQNSVVILLVLYFYIYKSRESVLLFYDAGGLWWEGRYIQILSASFNLIVNIVLVQFIGLHGILISTILAITIFDIPLIAGTVFKNCFDRKNGVIIYLRDQCRQFIIMLIIIMITNFICSMVFQEERLFFFFMRIIICMFLPNMLFVFLNRKSYDFTEMIKYFNVKRKDVYEGHN